MGLFGNKAKQTDDERKLANRTPEVSDAIARYLAALRQGDRDASLTFKMIMSMTADEKEESDRLRAGSSGPDDVRKFG